MENGIIKALLIERTGGPEVLKQVNKSIDNPREGEVLIRHKVIGLNRYDLECRRGIRRLAKFPAILGKEATGVVEKVSTTGNNNFRVGDRVVYCTAPFGAYCEKRIIDQKYLVKIPDDIPDEVAAAVLFKGMAAHYLLYRAYRALPGAFLLVHGANGGVGQILCQWADHVGCKVIGTVSSNDKKEIAVHNGCQYAINYNDGNFVKQIMEITNGKGVNAVYDSLGSVTSKISFESLSIFGVYVSYGQISGATPNINLSTLSSRSLFVTSTSMHHYKSNIFEIGLTAMEIFAMIKRGYIKVHINKRYRFDEIKKAHEDMENRKLNGLNIIVV